MARLDIFFFKKFTNNSPAFCAFTKLISSSILFLKIALLATSIISGDKHSSIMSSNNNIITTLKNLKS